MISREQLIPPTSEIFSFEDRYLKVNLQFAVTDKDGSERKYTATNFTEADKGFVFTLFNTPGVYDFYADGRSKDMDWVNNRFEIYKSRFEKRQPTGGLIIRNGSNESIGFVVAGGGDDAGVSEIAYAIMPDHQNKKIGTALLQALVEKWAPEVIRMSDFYDSFTTCFSTTVSDNNISQRLRRLDATYAPFNHRSGAVQAKAGFLPATTGLNNPDLVMDLSTAGTSITDKEGILAKFYNQPDSQFKANERYACVYGDGQKATIKYSNRWYRFSCHMEKVIAQHPTASITSL